MAGFKITDIRQIFGTHAAKAAKITGQVQPESQPSRASRSGPREIPAPQTDDAAFFYIKKFCKIPITINKRREKCWHSRLSAF